MFPFQQRQVEGMVIGVVDEHLVQDLATPLVQMLSLVTLRTGHATAAVG